MGNIMINMNTIPHLRPLLRLAESAQKVGDDELVCTALAAAEILAQGNSPINMKPVLEYLQALVSCCDHCYMVYDEKHLAELRHSVMQELARYDMSLIEKKDQKALTLPPMIQLVTAMYIRTYNDKTEGVSVALVIDENKEVQFPRRGPLISELREYHDENHLLLGSVESWLPNELADYRLMHGSVETQDILPEELIVMSF